MKDWSKKCLGYLAAGLFAVGAVTGAGAGLAKARAAAGTAPVVAQSAMVESKQNVQVEEQQPSYAASIRVNELQQDNEQAEAQYLAKLAKITPDEAKAAALKAVPGQVTGVSLDNENGNLVYSVEIKNGNEVVDVKVDAGNGQVLAQDRGQDEEKGGKELKQKEKKEERETAPEAETTR
ncbi:PepSY domain-containing protein [Ammonifex thiophilus]|uniref:Peptidase M4 n=1 Tax=Ammonifex thiophilus TaxID=444093 RepID=A0A3D8P4J7_9THEO|nr:PepSY domain-containing protein [Ammonifex thiophilus]RDV84033.1 peptidase M4 [Ammonifex thiophilus]